MRRTTVADLPMLLSRYDRAVAATLFEPVDCLHPEPAHPCERQRPDPVDHPGTRVIDPRGAVEVVEGLPKARSLSINDPTNWARQTLADHLAKPPDRRWMSIWRFHSGCGISMFEEVYRDL